ncbi:hypothetical protein LEP1GSC116_0260 [Leptospira interrogans serovar Icterohaemorrhagiae str. Verdun HP]|uniref:Uncharacterized protein n=1 Tax=Leptospira interrogans serovar Icterohaemorrhagiae str. Verdun HP TaxID=1049910 RepID=M6R3Z2_LEPIR|nr:hypothetical protein LEP1GSC116_0260 [Leptospira interrogans serovar Icterohaemorrhagiae str. Verdun HP]
MRFILRRVPSIDYVFLESMKLMIDDYYGFKKIPLYHP